MQAQNLGSGKFIFPPNSLYASPSVSEAFSFFALAESFAGAIFNWHGAAVSTFPANFGVYLRRAAVLTAGKTSKTGILLQVESLLNFSPLCRRRLCLAPLTQPPGRNLQIRSPPVKFY